MNRSPSRKKKFLNTEIWERIPKIRIGIVFIAIIWGFGYMISHHKNAIEKRYGFCTMTPEIRLIPCHIEPIMIRCITPGGTFDNAGFKDKDILILPKVHSVSGFHKLLEKPQGTIIEFMVIPYSKFKPDCEPDNWGEPVKRRLIVPNS